MNYRLIVVCIIVLGCIVMLPPASADPAVMISGYTIAPGVLFPGDEAVLTLTVKNAELTSTRTTVSTEGGTTTTTAKTISAFIEQISVLSVTSGNQSIWATTKYDNIGSLAPGASIDVPFKIKVDPKMPQGLYFLIVQVQVQSYPDVIYPIPVDVRNDSLDLVATDIPSRISMSGNTQLTLTVINRRKAPVDDVIITPQPAPGLSFFQESVFVGTLAAGASEDAVFLIHPLATGVQNLSFNLSYKNGNNQHFAMISQGLEVIQTLDVAPIITSFPTSIQKGGHSTITIEVYNAKTEAITGVIVTPMSDAIMVPSEYFIGAMLPDDVFSTSFDIYTNDLDYGEYTVGFKVSFKQDKDYYEVPTVGTSFEVVKGQGTTLQGPGGGSSSGNAATSGIPSLTTCLLTLGVVVIVIVVIVFAFMRWRKRRKEP